METLHQHNIYIYPLPITMRISPYANISSLSHFQWLLPNTAITSFSNVYDSTTTCFNLRITGTGFNNNILYVVPSIAATGCYIEANAEL